METLLFGCPNEFSVGWGKEGTGGGSAYFAYIPGGHGGPWHSSVPPLPEDSPSKPDEKNEKDTGTADFETALEFTKFGKFHLLLIFIGGVCYLATGFEYGLHAYALPFAECDLQITTAEMGIINAMFLAGSIVCSYCWGVVADTIGRRKVLMISLFLDGISTVIASLSPSFYMFAIVRFVSGFMIGAPGCLATSYVGEFCVNRHRTRAICLIGFCWTIAWMLLPGVAWLIIPNKMFNFETPIMTVQSWRVFVCIIGLPPIVAGLCVYFLPETPKFLFIQGKKDEAMGVLKRMFHMNTGKDGDEYPVVRLVATYASDSKAQDVEEARSDPSPKGKKLGEVCSSMIVQTKEVFCPPHLQKTILCSTIYFANFFGYYGLGLWLPALFDRFEAFYADNPNETVTVCEVSKLMMKEVDLEMEARWDEVDCSVKSINVGVFGNTFIIGAVTCVGNILAVVLSNKVGGRLLSVASNLTAGISAIMLYFMRSIAGTTAVNCLFMMGIGTAMITISTTNMIVAGCCGCAIYLIRSPVQNLITSALFIATVNSALNVHNYCVVNMFPTYIRGMGVCVGMMFGRLGAVASNIIFGLLIDVSCEIPIFLIGGIVIAGGLLCLLMPKNSSQAAE